MDQQEPTRGTPTQWGEVDYVTKLAPGIVFATTPSHGGIWLSPAREQQIPEQIRTIARSYSATQWYEEDCDVVIPTLWFVSDLLAASDDAPVEDKERMRLNIDSAMLQIAYDKRFSSVLSTIKARYTQQTGKAWN